VREVAPGLWVTERSLRFAGVEVGTRMTVIRLQSRGLFLHSPVSLDAHLREVLAALGSPRFAVAPNRFHHLFIGEYPRAYPDLELFIAPGLEKKQPDLSGSKILNDTAPAGWSGEIEQLLFRGYPIANEIVFFHRPSRTLVMTDLVFNIGGESPPLTRVAFRVIRGYGHFGPTVLEKLLIRDRAAARECLKQILAWDFERVILAHGRILERGGREPLQRGYAWLL
jgi:hypothetical protein